MTGPRRTAGALSRWTMCAVLVHLILTQSDSETRGKSADDPVLYGCANPTCKTPSRQAATPADSRYRSARPGWSRSVKPNRMLIESSAHGRTDSSLESISHKHESSLAALRRRMAWYSF